METKQNEEIVFTYFIKIGLHPERFSKQEQANEKTPDFRVFKNATLKFYCEVKTISKDRWLETQPKQEIFKGVTVAEGCRRDPTFNRISDDIHNAVKQFYSVNPKNELPNVLAFVNHDTACNIGDLDSVFTGNFMANDGTKHPIYRNVSEGRIKNDKWQVDLFIWFDRSKPFLRFTDIYPNHKNTLCDLFGIAEEDICMA